MKRDQVMNTFSPHRPQKKWGQHFLRNAGAVRRIVGAVEPRSDEIVLEIGPGEGALTKELLGLGVPVVAIEIDPDLAGKLRESFSTELLQITSGDATKVPLPDRPFRAVGNLPYNVANAIIRRTITSPRCRRAVFMVQKEVADRITARSNEDPYGYFSLLIQLYAEARVLLTLEPGSFHPRPKVRSAVVVLDPVARDFQSPKQEIIDLVSQSFRMRRKKLVNNLIGYRGLDRAKIQEILRSVDLDERIRAETMSLEEFDRLAVAISLGAPHETDRDRPKS